MRASVTDTDKGLRALAARLGKRGFVSVGVHAAEGEATHLDPSGGAKGGGLTVAEIATIHEYGLGDVPERSFIRAWFDERQSENLGILRRIGAQVIKGRITADQGLDQAGLYFVGSIQKRIAGNIPPPLAPATIARKTVDGRAGNVALINTGQLRSSIRHKVSRDGST